MSDMWIDPVVADYAVSAGVPVRDPAGGVANAVYLRLMTPLGSYWADPALGSRLGELARSKDVPRVQRLAVQYAQQALKPLLDDGRATAIGVSVEHPFTSRLNLLIEVMLASGERLTFTHPIKVI